MYIIFHRSFTFPPLASLSVSALLNRAAQTQVLPLRSVPLIRGHDSNVRIRLLPPSEDM